MAPEGAYSHVIVGGVRFAILFLGGPPKHNPVAAVTLVDELFDDRTATLIRFQATLRNRSIKRDPRITALRRRTLRQMLQAIDGRQSGATYQEVAQVLFRLSPVTAITWKSMPERDAIMRRVRDGLKLSNGGYRQLLRHHRSR